MRLLIMGPPGSGKGTQAAGLAGRVGGPHISTGDIFRSHVRRRTELGVLAEKYLASGEYVPDEVTDDMVRARLSEPDAATAFVLDGYPRTARQAVTLDALLAGRGAALDGVVLLEVPEEELVSRILLRARDSGRTDDTEDVVRRRLAVHAEQTAPLERTYANRGLLRRVPGTGAPEEVAERIAEAVGR